MALSGSRLKTTFRALVVGKQRSGKTSLLAAAVVGDGIKAFKNDYKPTQGLAFQTEHLELPFIGGSKLTVWDSGSYDSHMQKISQEYDASDIILVVYDITDKASLTSNASLASAEEWLKREANPRKTYFLVGTKSDLSDQRQVTSQEAQALANKYNATFLGETSAKNAENTQTLFYRMATQCIQPQLNNADSRDLPSYRITLVGDGGVGKTSFVNFLQNEALLQGYSATMGVAQPITSKKIVHGQISKLQFWDTGGSPLFRAASFGAFGGADVYVIFYDVNNPTSLAGVSEWVRLMGPSLILEGKKPFYLVGNKTDLPKKVTAEDVKAAQANIKENLKLDILPPSFEISSKDGRQVSELCASLAEALPAKKPAVVDRLIEDDNPSLWSRYHRGIIAGVVVAAILLGGLAIATPFLLPVLAPLVSMLILGIIGGGAVLGALGLSALVGFIAQKCFGGMDSVTDLPDLEDSMPLDASTIGLGESIIGNTEFNSTYRELMLANPAIEFDSPPAGPMIVETPDESYESGSESEEDLPQGNVDGAEENVLSNTPGR